MNYHFVDANTDQMAEILRFCCAEYEKCNLHPPFTGANQFVEVLREEIQEARDECDDLSSQCGRIEQNQGDEKELNQAIAELEAVAYRALMEIFQVLSVCDKWRVIQRLEKEEG